MVNLLRVLVLLGVSIYAIEAYSLPILSADYSKRVRSFSRSGFKVLDSSKLSFKEAFEYKRKSRQSSSNGSVNFSLLIDADSDWITSSNGMSLLEAEILKLRHVLNQCDVDLKRVYVGVFELSQAAKDWLDPSLRDPYKEPGEVPLMRVFTPPTKPLVILANGEGAYAYNEKSVRGLSRHYPSMPLATDVSKIGWDSINGYNQRFSTQASFSLLAHEIVHIMGNVGHVNQATDNLMNSYSGQSPQDSGQAKSGKLESWQCQEIIDHWMDQ